MAVSRHEPGDHSGSLVKKAPMSRGMREEPWRDDPSFQARGLSYEESQSHSGEHVSVIFIPQVWF